MAGGAASTTPIEAQIPPAVAAAAATAAAVVLDNRGKHRFLEELKRLDQETTSLEEELEELEKTENASRVCQKLLLNVETRPDPLLSVTNGPPNPSWDQWFEGPKESQGCRCWIL